MGAESSTAVSIGLDGIPGSGKSSTARLVCSILNGMRINSVYIPEYPQGHAPIVRNYLDELDPDDNLAVMLRMRLVEKVCRDAAQRKKIPGMRVVVSERSVGAIEMNCIVYGIPFHILDYMMDYISRERSDLTILLDVDINVARERKRLQKIDMLRAQKKEIVEPPLRLLHDDRIFKMIDAYEELALKYGWSRVDANQDRKTVARYCVKLILAKLEERKLLTEGSE